MKFKNKYIFIFMIFPSLLRAEVTVSEKFKYYSVYPVSKSGLLDELRNKSPITEDGDVFFGYTYSSINWRFKWKYNSSKCWLTSVETSLESTYTMPKLETDYFWVKGVWDKWYPNLMKHEKGHHLIALEIAELIQEGISNLSPQSSCSKLENRANQIGFDYMEQLDVLNESYDLETNHGETEGASLFSYL